MFVKDRMNPKPICGVSNMPVIEAQTIMDSNKIRHLPIIDSNNNLIGLITRSSLQAALPSDVSRFSQFEINYTLSKILVDSVMVKNVVTIGPDIPIEEAAWLMADKRIGTLPVVENGELVGIISGEDLFNAMTTLLGSQNPGIRVTVEQPDQTGVIARLTTAIAQEGGYLSGCVGYYPKDKTDTWISVCKVENIEEKRLIEVLGKLKDTTILDIRQFQEQE